MTRNNTGHRGGNLDGLVVCSVFTHDVRTAVIAITPFTSPQMNPVYHRTEGRLSTGPGVVQDRKVNAHELREKRPPTGIC